MPKPVTSSVERRVLTHEFRVSEGETPTISGYAALFDTLSEDMGYWREEIDPHAFDKLLTPDLDCRALFNHDPNCVLGRTTSGTLKLSIDARGLAYAIDPPDTTLAKDLIVSMRRKDVTQSSFGFICKRDQWTENQDGTVTRRILEFQELLDVSPVTFPAYAGTTSQTRSMPASMPAEMRSKFSKRDLEATDDDLVDDDDDTCDCDCSQCLAGACNLCSDDDCTDEVCACYNQRSASVTDAELRKMQMKLSLLALQK